MSKQRTRKLVTKILRKTCSSLVKMISDVENNFMQNNCNKCMKYRNILPNHKKCQYGIIYSSFTWCRPDRYKNSRLIIKNKFLYYIII